MKKNLGKILWAGSITLITIFFITTVGDPIRYFLEKNWGLLFTAQWVIPIVLIFLTVAPFIVLSKEKFHPVKWKYILLAYPLSVLLFVFSFWIFGVFETWLYNHGVNYYGEVGRAMSNVLSILMFSMIIFWPASILYSRRLLTERFSLKSWLLALLLSVLFFLLLVYLLMYIFIPWGLGQISKYL